MTDINIYSDAFHAAEAALQSNADNLVHREVMANMSSVVATLARGYASLPSESHLRDLSDLADQAFNLACPIPDYEEAAIQAGYKSFPALHGAIADPSNIAAGYCDETYPTWEACCESEGIEPYDREVYEFWAVSTWLAEKLSEAGERVDTDFSGLNVWARTTTGQAISMDGVIRDITRALHA